MSLSATYLPEFFESELANQYERADVERIIAGCSTKRAVTLRANTLLSSADEIASVLDTAGLSWSPVSWYTDAFIVHAATERDIWNLPAYQDGKLYLQSLSSMIPALILEPRQGEDICDMCAAPGGKTTQIAAIANAGAYITACEMHAPRAEKLEYNLSKQGARNVTILRTDARQLDEFFSFDRILVDAPCSGSGTLISYDPKIAKRFTPKLIEKSVKAQKALLEKGLSLLKPGATLVYSTCSVLARENEEVVEWALKRAKPRGVFEVKPIELSGAESIPLLPTSLEGALCVCPTERYEGFFVVKITRS